MAADGVVTGYGLVDGRKVFAYAQDFTSVGGALGEMHAAKICKVMDMALEAGCPCVGLNDSGGARIQEAVDALSGYGQIFRRNSLASGLIPQISVIMGPCAGGAVYSPALTDLIIMVDQKSQMFITGPRVIEATTGEKVSEEELGGANTQTSVSGVAHLMAADEEEAIWFIRMILSYLPSSARDKAPVYEYERGDEYRPALNDIVPDSSRRAYDVRTVIGEIADPESFFELQPNYATNIVTGFGRIGGRSVGFICNQPMIMGGCLDINASDKASRFIQMCDAFGLPLINLVDVPGFLPGTNQEYGGIIRHGAKLLYVYSVAESPKITVIMRKAYGGSYLAMCSKDLGADMVLAWPTSEIAVMGAEGAANIIFAKRRGRCQHHLRQGHQGRQGQRHRRRKRRGRRQGRRRGRPPGEDRRVHRPVRHALRGRLPRLRGLRHRARRDPGLHPGRSGALREQEARGPRPRQHAPIIQIAENCVFNNLRLRLRFASRPRL